MNSQIIAYTYCIAKWDWGSTTLVLPGIQNRKDEEQPGQALTLQLQCAITVAIPDLKYRR